MQLNKLKIGKLTANVPIMQGGMAVKVSTAHLAAAVANEGGIGIIGGSGLTSNELKSEIRKAKKLTNGIVGVNIMVAVNKFKELVKTSIREKIDLIVAGAVFSRDLFTLGRENNIEIVPVVSSLKLAKISEKLGASAVVVEGKEAGGHLGTDQPVKTLVKKIINKIKIPLIAAGGIIDGRDIAEMIKLGVDGVQMGSRFVASTECKVAEEFKLCYINAADDDGIIINSPVGLPGRAIKNKFTDRLKNGEINTGKACEHLCLKKCTRTFCIMKALEKARKGNMEEGLVFAGENAYKINEILSVNEIISKLITEAESHLGGEAK